MDRYNSQITIHSMEDTIRPLNYADIETSGPINLLETTNNLKSSLKKFSQKAKGSHISRERIHHFRKWKNKTESLSENHLKPPPDVDSLCFSNCFQPDALSGNVFLPPKSSNMYWNEKQLQLEMEILKFLSLNTSNECCTSDD